MFKITLAKVKRAWTVAHGPRCKCNSRTFTGRNHRPTFSMLRRATKSTRAGKEHVTQCHRCKQIIEYIFGPPSTIENPHRHPTFGKILETQQDTQKIQLNHTIETACEKCNRLISKVFGKDENDNLKGIPKAVTKINIDDGYALQSTTAKQTEEQLAQKIEAIEETPLVEAEKQKLEGFNITPRVLGHLVEINIIKTIEFIGNKDHHAMPLVNFAAGNNSGNTDKSSGTDDLDPFKILAKRSLDVPPNQIDDQMLHQLKQIGVPTTPSEDIPKAIQKRSKLKDTGETATVEDVEARKKESQLTSDSKNHENNIEIDDDKIGESGHIKQSRGVLYSESNFETHKSTNQLNNTYSYPTKEEISQGLPDPQYFYTGFKPKQPADSETDKPHLERPSGGRVTLGLAQQQYVYNTDSNFPNPPIPQGFFFNQDSYWGSPTDTAGYQESYTPSESKPRNSSDKNTIQADQKTPSRAIEGRPNISLFQETFITEPSEIEKPSQCLVHPEYICPNFKVQVEQSTVHKSIPKKLSTNPTPNVHFNTLPIKKRQIHKNPSKKEIGHGLVLQESFYSSPTAEVSKSSFTAVRTDPQRFITQRTIVADQKTPIRAIEARPEIQIGARSQHVYSALCAESHLIPKDEEKTYYKMLLKVKERNLKYASKPITKVDPVKGKCGKGKPRCPPPPPQCPPPNSCPPRPCPPRQPPCPKPCRPACPSPCTPPAPGCDPRNNPCKFKKIFWIKSLQNISSQVNTLSSKKIIDRTASLPIIVHKTQSVDFSTNVVVQKNTELPLHMTSSQFSTHLLDSDVRKYDVDPNAFNFARTFEPWVPIPSSPIPKKIVKKPYVCPKEGCKVIPPPKLGDPCGSPCKGGEPCTGFPKRRS